MAGSVRGIRSTQFLNNLVQDIHIGERIPSLFIFSGKCEPGTDNRPWDHHAAENPLIMSHPT